MRKTKDGWSPLSKGLLLETYWKALPLRILGRLSCHRRRTAPSSEAISPFLSGQGRQTSWETIRYPEPALLASTARLYANERAPTHCFFGMMSKDCWHCWNPGSPGLWAHGLPPWNLAPRKTGCKKIIHSTLLMTEIWPFVTYSSCGGGRRDSGTLEKYSKIFYQARTQKDTGENYGFLPNQKLNL